MRSIDIHTHLVPQCMWQAIDAGGDWYGMKYNNANRTELFIKEGRVRAINDRTRQTPEKRLEDMDKEGTDLQVVSVHTQVFGYHLDSTQGAAQARDINDEIASMVERWPQRFAGMATLPMQDVSGAINELDRAVHRLGLKGAELDTVVNGKSWDEPEYLPLFKAAESMGAVLFYHPQPQDNIMVDKVNRYGIPNSIGVTLEDTMVVSTLIFGGILDKCPDLKVCIAHGGGPACFGMGRLDRGWQVRSEARVNISRPPSYYQSRLYYDTVVMSESALRFMIDAVGIDHVVLGSDYPFVGWDPSPGGWVQSCESLSQEEKDKILWKNLEALLRLGE
ncbi:MAG: amidohydrolase family protein [Dehalococcoidia bacterium]